MGASPVRPPGRTRLALYVLVDGGKEGHGYKAVLQVEGKDDPHAK